MNGKGFTFNQLPNERYDDNQEQFLYKPNAYKSGKHSLQPASEVKKGMDLAKKLAEENKALGGNPNDEEMVKTDERYDFREIKVPEWVCSSICAGLNLDDLVSGESTIENPDDFNMNDSNLFRTEEEYHIDLGRKGKDKRLDRPPSLTPNAFKNYNGEYTCERSNINLDDCVEKGLELSTWFAERILNSEKMCNWDGKDCGSLFGAAAPAKK